MQALLSLSFVSCFGFSERIGGVKKKKRWGPGYRVYFPLFQTVLLSAAHVEALAAAHGAYINFSMTHNYSLLYI